jgi:chaperonin GroES
MNVIPIHDYVLIEYDEAAKVTKGGIHIPDSAQKRPERGIVKATGPGRMLDGGGFAVTPVEVGQKVMFDKFAGSLVTLEEVGNKRLVIVRATEIFAIVQDQSDADRF